jgi:nucleotide-binding universal stress UspA family protein
MATNEIVVGVDGSDTAVSALRWALDHARHAGATVVAVHAWEYPFTGDMTGTAAMPDRDLLVGGAEATLARTIERAGPAPDVQVVPETIEGSASMRLIERSADADLLVVGARGHGGFLSLLLGSVATQCVNHATVPVVVVPNVERGR